MFILSDGQKSGIVFSYAEFLRKRLVSSLFGGTLEVADVGSYAKIARSFFLSMVLLSLFNAVADAWDESGVAKSTTAVSGAIFIGLLWYRGRHVKPLRVGLAALKNRVPTPSEIGVANIYTWITAIQLEIKCGHFIDPQYRVFAKPVLQVSMLIMLVNAAAYLSRAIFSRKR